MSTSNSKGRKNSTKRALSAAGIKRSLPRFYKRHPQARRAINAAAASACILAVIGGSSLLAISALSPKAAPAGPEVEIAAPAMGTLQVDQGSGSDVMTAIVRPRRPRARWRPRTFRRRTFPPRRFRRRRPPPPRWSPRRTRTRSRGTGWNPPSITRWLPRARSTRTRR